MSTDVEALREQQLRAASLARIESLPPDQKAAALATMSQLSQEAKLASSISQERTVILQRIAPEFFVAGRVAETARQVTPEQYRVVNELSTVRAQQAQPLPTATVETFTAVAPKIYDPYRITRSPPDLTKYVTQVTNTSTVESVLKPITKDIFEEKLEPEDTGGGPGADEVSGSPKTDWITDLSEPLLPSSPEINEQPPATQVRVPWVGIAILALTGVALAATVFKAIKGRKRKWT